jgi:hypothetical protein
VAGCERDKIVGGRIVSVIGIELFGLALFAIRPTMRCWITGEPA